MGAIAGLCAADENCGADAEVVTLPAAFPFSARRPKSCTAVSAALTAEGAVALGSLDTGELATWSSGLDLTNLSAKPLRVPNELTALDVRCMAVSDAPLPADDDDEWPPWGGGQSRTWRCCLGTSSGEAVMFSFDPVTSRVVDEPAVLWAAHSSAPSCGQRHSGVSSLAVDGRCIVTGGADSDACIWDLADLEGEDTMRVSKTRRLFGAHGGAVTAVATVAAQRMTATAGEDGLVRLWTPACRAEGEVLPLHRGQGTPSSSPSSCSRGVTGMSLDGKHCRLCTSAEDGTLRMWDIASGRPTRRFRCNMEQQRDQSAPLCPALRGLRAAAFDAGEAPTRLASGTTGGAWQLWDVRQWQDAPIAQHVAPNGGAEVCSVSVLGERLLTASLDGLVQLWDLRCVSDAPRLAPAGCVGDPTALSTVSMLSASKHSDL